MNFESPNNGIHQTPKNIAVLIQHPGGAGDAGR